ncbi:heterokaryon incompatibility protein-domain-containing protein [Halenospora varia]|nr:heterokaryon incompatibility protein-domain-containing protein [Halenospora varia]
MSPWKHDYSNLKEDPSEFRLVTIHRGVRLNYIVASLDTYPLNDPPPYQALSYVWGPFDFEAPCIIELDNCRFEVTTNLWRALYYLRSEKEEVKFWIDAICINQEDLEERSSQVQLMRDIYRGAGRTVVWLGDESFWSLRLFEFLDSVDTTRGWKDDDERQLALEREMKLQTLLAANEGIQKIVERGLYGDIAQRDFWERIWIVQEVAISPEVMIYCGPNKMAWQEFCNAICEYSLEVLLGALFLRDPLHIYQYSLRELLNRRAKLTLGDVLASLRRSKATDPRDMVYGLLGLFPNIPIRPDYLTASPQDVYLSLVEYCLIEEKSLDIITLCRKTTSGQGLPSWVPDWTESWTRPNNQEELSWDVTNIDLPPFQLILRYAQREEKYPQSDAIYHGNISIVEVFVRTIFTDLDADFQRVTSTKYNKFWDIDNSESTEWAHEVWTSQMSTNRRLFVTDNGYIGLGPVKMRKGDQICILYGCSVPIVLRKASGGVTLVGEAYLHGLMDGEALALVKEENFVEMEWSIF